MIEKEVFKNCVNSISAGIAKGSSFFAISQTANFDEEKNAILEKMESILSEARTLKLGIVGEVNAGKSSFLNALVFDGEDVLPKAATPMTAALTKLNYSDSPSARIFFYSKSDWDRIQGFSDSYEKEIDAKFEEAKNDYEKSLKEKTKAFFGNKPTRESIESAIKNILPKKMQGCRELTRMVEKRNLRPGDFLGKQETIPPGMSISEYNQKLNEYIGSDGEYTPLVSHTELYFDNPLLKDIEIIDTPGLNDAVVSRSQKTKDFLKECDVVFLLSYVGQFLLDEDIKFILNTLPDEAIKEAVLIGSKFDSGVLQYTKTSSFKEAFNASRRSFDKQADDNIRKHAKVPHPPVIDKLVKSLPPNYISSRMYGAAKKKMKNIPLSNEEAQLLEQLKKRFSGFEDSPDFLLDLSGIARIREGKLVEIKKNKMVIINERVNEFLERQAEKLVKILENIKEVTLNNYNVLKSTSVDALQGRLEKLKNVLGSIHGKTARVFLKNITEIKKSLQGISIDIFNSIDKYNNKEVEVTTRIEENQKTTGILWWTKLHITYTKINSANVSEVIGNIRKYVVAIQEVLLHKYDTLLDRQGLRDEIAAVVVEAHDLSDRNFNADEILLPIERMLNDFSIAPISIDTEHYNEIIFEGFSDAVVENADINRLLLTQEKVLQQIARDMRYELEKEEKRMEETMLKRSETFISDIHTNIKQNYEIIGKKLQDKERNLKRYEEFIEELTQYQRQLRVLYSEIK